MNENGPSSTQVGPDGQLIPPPPIPIQPNLSFSVHEQDKAIVRENIVQAAVMAPDVIRIQLAVCINMIIKHDFPHRWSDVVQKVR